MVSHIHLQNSKPKHSNQKSIIHLHQVYTLKSKTRNSIKFKATKLIEEPTLTIQKFIQHNSSISSTTHHQQQHNKKKKKFSQSQQTPPEFELRKWIEPYQYTHHTRPSPPPPLEPPLSPKLFSFGRHILPPPHQATPPTTHHHFLRFWV